MNMQGTVKAVCVSSARGTEKRPVERAVLIQGHGIEGDAHAGSWHRQVSLYVQVYPLATIQRLVRVL